MFVNVDRYEGDAEDQERDSAYVDAPVCPAHDVMVNAYLCCPVCGWDSTTEGSAA